jgi:hypothetical protein
MNKAIDFILRQLETLSSRINSWSWNKRWAIEIKVMATKNKVPEKFKDIEAVSYGTPSDNSLVVSFHNFENRDEMMDFQEYLFSRIKMHHHPLISPQTIH